MAGIQVLPDRILSRLDFDFRTGCWEWTGPTTTGMPMVSWDGRGQLGNRVAYQACVGPIPPKGRVRHRCSSLLCMYPGHLYLDDQSTPEGKRRALLEFVTPLIVVLDNGCWDWTGGKSKWGYAIVKNNGGSTSVRLHKIIWEIVCGPVPEGMVLGHTCHNDKDCGLGTKCPHRRCVNPAHLEVVTNTENILRGESSAAKKARQTHCQFGHEFTPENTYRRPGAPTMRVCRECRRGVIGDRENAQRRACRKESR